MNFFTQHPGNIKDGDCQEKKCPQTWIKTKKQLPCWWSIPGSTIGQIFNDFSFFNNKNSVVLFLLYIHPEKKISITAISLQVVWRDRRDTVLRIFRNNQASPNPFWRFWQASFLFLRLGVSLKKQWLITPLKSLWVERILYFGKYSRLCGEFLLASFCRTRQKSKTP